MPEQPSGKLLAVQRHPIGLIKLRTAVLHDYPYIEALQRQHVNNTGFVPKTAIQNHLQRQSYVLLTINGQPEGYLMSAGGIRKPYRLIQVAVDEEAWRLGLGTLLIHQALAKARRKPKPDMCCTVREGLPMNPTVISTGAKPFAYDDSPKARRKRLIHYAWENSHIDAPSVIAPQIPRQPHVNHTYDALTTPPSNLLSPPLSPSTFRQATRQPHDCPTSGDLDRCLDLPRPSGCPGGGFARPFPGLSRLAPLAERVAACLSFGTEYAGAGARA